ncbi:MAG: MBOAT family protein [Planctomycetes bacterium]|nr:MBOAT family protein [Planctomycetota bacterium]MCB9903556.1 MBOAT family protein [Planctomycetota bacterium]
MVFSTPVFLFLFLPLCLAIYFAVPWRWRNVALLVASLIFYAWGEPKAVAVMLVSIAANYAFGLRIERLRGAGASEGKLRRVVALSVATNLGLLVAFKYSNWIWAQAQALLVGVGVEAAAGWELREIPLPVGISFFTFQAMSYVIDVYRRQGEVQRKPVDFALYVALFPQLIAGPIVRYRDVARQIAQRSVARADFAEGIRRLLIGLGKKVLIADVVAATADQIFNNVPQDQLNAPVAWLATVCYTLQIYFDFSGYSDMAIGLSRMFGFHLLENFRWPYVSRSITEFWRRWHISLSSWYRDYLYIPLGGNRLGAGRTYLNLLVVFFLCGLWHGASWSFVVWGLFHGAFLILERAGLSRLLQRLPTLLRRAYLLLAVMVGWVFFRVETLSGALTHLEAMFGFGSQAGLQHVNLYLDRELALAMALGLLGSTPWVAALWSWRERLDARGASRGLRLSYDLTESVALLLVLVLVAIQVSAERYSPFIYFRF